MSLKGGGGGTQTQVVRQNADPWGPSQGYLKNIMAEAESLYKNNIGPSYYPGSTVVPFTEQTTQGLQGIQNRAQNLMQNNVFDQMLGQAGNLMASSGLTPEMQAALSPLMNVSSGANAINTGGLFSGLFDQAGQPGAVQQNLADMASGKYLAEGNPYYKDRLLKDIADATGQIKSSFSGMGRYGSKAMQDSIGETASNMLMQGLENDFNRQQAAQMQAAGMLSSEQLARLGQQASAAQGLTNVQGANIANQVGATNSLLGTYGQGLNTALNYGLASPGFMAAGYDPATRMLGVGQAHEAQLGAELADNIRRFEFENARPWQQLGLFMNTVQGLGGMGSAQTNVTPIQTNPLGSMLGGALGGMQLGQMLFGNPLLGAVGGGLLGLL